MHNELQKGRQLSDIEAKFSSSGGPAFREKKQRFLASRPLLAQHLLESISPSQTRGYAHSHATPSTPRSWAGKFGAAAASMIPNPVFSFSSVNAPSKSISDADFLTLVPSILDYNSGDPQLKSEIRDTVDAARQYFIAQIAEITRKALKKIDDVRRLSCQSHLRASQEHARKVSLDGTRHEFLARIDGHFQRHGERFVTFNLAINLTRMPTQHPARFITIEDVQSPRMSYARYGEPPQPFTCHSRRSRCEQIHTASRARSTYGPAHLCVTACVPYK